MRTGCSRKVRAALSETARLHAQAHGYFRQTIAASLSPWVSAISPSFSAIERTCCLRSSTSSWEVATAPCEGNRPSGYSEISGYQYKWCSNKELAHLRSAR